MHPLLSTSYKGVYPFKLGTTSYIYPDNIVDNVSLIGPYVDEIELLLFESKPGSLPSRKNIDTLNSLSEKYDITYNIHLPTDIFLGDPDPNIRQHAVNTVIKVMDLVSSLSCSTCTLHLEYNNKTINQDEMKKWQQRTWQSMQQLIASGIKGESISIETLMYPFAWVEKIIKDFNFSVCIDIGHLILLKTDLECIFNRFKNITSIIHLHGVQHDRDHMPLDTIPKEHMASVMKILTHFTRSVSLEVFSFSHLVRSLNFLDVCWQAYDKRQLNL
jgi:endonuclease IV